jgi:hypothetical protein
MHAGRADSVSVSAASLTLSRLALYLPCLSQHLEQTLSRRRFLAAAGVGGASLALSGLAPRASGFPLADVARSGDSIVVQWNEALLEAVRRSRLGPPMVARALAIAHTCMYDAWAAYDERAVGTALGGSLRQPARSRTLANTEQAVSFAAHRAAADLFPASTASMLDPLMLSLGYEPGDESTDTSTPTGVGNVAARAVLDARHNDGANQLGDSRREALLRAHERDLRCGCCAWDNKRAFDSVRPITAIRTLFRGRLVRAWGGPYQGTKHIDGAAWFPYQPTTFPTPPFPEYSSGHSNFSAAGAEILTRFTHRDRFGASVMLPAGSSKVEPRTVPAQDVTLFWPTFLDAANEAGISRRYGGIHFEQGDLDARATGRATATLVWHKAQEHWRGS